MTRDQKIKKIKLLTERKRRIVLNSYYEFFIYMWDVINDKPLSNNWHIKYLCDEIQDAVEYVLRRENLPFDEIIINIPPGTTKSSIVTIFLNAWLWAKDPTLTEITNSYSSDLAIYHSRKTRDVLRSEKYKQLFPELKIRQDVDGKSNFATDKGGERITSSTGSTVTGKHADIIINDDPQNPTTAVSDPKRESANDYHASTLMSRKKDKDKALVIIIMQRLHQNDLTGFELAKDKIIKHISLPAELTGNIKTIPAELAENYIEGQLDPDRLSTKTLLTAGKDLGSYGYANQYLQLAAPLEGGIIKKHWFKTYRLEQLPKKIRNAVCDTAYTEETKNDPCAIAYYVIDGQKLYILNYTEKRLELYQFMQLLNQENLMWGSSQSIIEVEPKATGKAVVSEMKRTGTLNIKEYKMPRDAKGKELSKDERLYASSPFVECGNVYVLEGAHWVDNFIDNVCGFPNMKHDEPVDLLNMMVEKAKTANLVYKVMV